MIEYQYRKMMWGMLLVFLDFRFDAFDILPDFIGYLMVVGALEQLRQSHKSYGQGKIYGGILSALSLVELLQTPQTTGFHFHGLGITGMIISVITLVMRLALVYHICHGIKELARAQKAEELEDWARFRWRFYVIVNYGMSILMAFSINFNTSTSPFWYIFITMGLVAELFFIGLIRYAGKVLGNPTEPVGE